MEGINPVGDITGLACRKQDSGKNKPYRMEIGHDGEHWQITFFDADVTEGICMDFPGHLLPEQMKTVLIEIDKRTNNCCQNLKDAAAVLQQTYGKIPYGIVDDLEKAAI